MKILAVFFISLSAIWAEPGIISGPELRVIFHQDKISEKQLEGVVSANVNKGDAISLGYWGLSQTMMAQYAFLPTTKLEHFNVGKQAIDNAIARDRSNIELRYIRLLVQLNAPWFLGYNKNAEEDLIIFVEGTNAETIDGKWKNIFIENLLMSRHLLPEQKRALEKAISPKFAID